MTWAVGDAAGQDGSHYVILIFSTPGRVSTFMLPAEGARKLSEQLAEGADRSAGGGLIVPSFRPPDDL